MRHELGEGQRPVALCKVTQCPRGCTQSNGTSTGLSNRKNLGAREYIAIRLRTSVKKCNNPEPSESHRNHRREIIKPHGEAKATSKTLPCGGPRAHTRGENKKCVQPKGKDATGGVHRSEQAIVLHKSKQSPCKKSQPVLVKVGESELVKRESSQRS